MGQKSLNDEENEKPTCDRSSEKNFKLRWKILQYASSLKKKKRKINIIEQDELLS